MGTCPDGQVTVMGKCPTGKVLDIHCVPETSGMPDYTPADDQLPFAFDSTEGVLWLFLCESGTWVAYDLSLCRLSPVDVDVIANLCEFLNIPVVFDNQGVCVEGTITLQKLADQIALCLDYQLPTEQPVVLGDGVSTTVVVGAIGPVTTYTVSANQVITTLVDNGDGTATYTNEADTPVVFPTGSNVTNGTGIGISGDGLTATPYVVSLDICDLSSVNRSDSQTLAACDGVNSRRVPIYKAGRRILVDNVTGEISAQPSMELFDVPINIVNFSIQKNTGGFDTGVVTVDINTISAIPTDAVGVMLRTSSGVNGQDIEGLPDADLLGWAWVLVAKKAVSIPLVDMFSSAQHPVLTSYSDTNFLNGDNDNISYPHIELNGDDISYKCTATWANTNGVDTATMRIDLVGFYF